jgi:hypothetical protein
MIKVETATAGGFHGLAAASFNQLTGGMPQRYVDNYYPFSTSPPVHKDGNNQSGMYR